MNKFNFVSHEAFPHDEYTKELVYFEINVPVRVAWVRKSVKNGGMFWSAVSTAATKDGQKEYFPAWMQDSNFVEKDMKAYLDSRKWETNSVFEQTSRSQETHQKPKSMDEVAEQDQLPF